MRTAGTSPEPSRPRGYEKRRFSRTSMISAGVVADANVEWLRSRERWRRFLHDGPAVENPGDRVSALLPRRGIDGPQDVGVGLAQVGIVGPDHEGSAAAGIEGEAGDDRVFPEVRERGSGAFAQALPGEVQRTETDVRSIREQRVLLPDEAQDAPVEDADGGGGEVDQIENR